MNEQTLKRLAEKALYEEPPYDNDQFPPSPYYRFLKVLAAYIKPSLSVELGVDGGGGSLHLALGYPEGRVVGVDIAYKYPDRIETVMQTCPNFDFWLGDSVKSAPDIHNQYGDVDILFVDTLHEKRQTLNEFDAWRPYLVNDGIVIFDDLFRYEMEDVWDVLPGNKLRLDKLHDGAERGGGFGVIWGLK